MKEKSMKDWGRDKTSFSNLPQEVTHTMYPKQPGAGGELDDTMTGIDEVCSKSHGKSSKYMSNQK